MTNLTRFREELGKIDFPADQTGFSPPLPAKLPADFHVAGTTACQVCHGEDCSSWSGSRHGHAWKTLLDKGSHVDPYCQHCHTTGYGLPGGFASLRTGSERVNVGCETCHGPSHAHARKPSIKTLYDARDRCVQCHDHENSPQFDYESFWSLIAHGEPAQEPAKTN
ncbi:MAG: cytochrome c family protein [Planctomycetia bacterium]|nr:cytochrome c family protein [Planctomycetia bacterium]